MGKILDRLCTPYLSVVSKSISADKYRKEEATYKKFMQSLSENISKQIDEYKQQRYADEPYGVMERLMTMKEYPEGARSYRRLKEAYSEISKATGAAYLVSGFIPGLIIFCTLWLLLKATVVIALFIAVIIGVFSAYLCSYAVKKVIGEITAPSVYYESTYNTICSMPGFVSKFKCNSKARTLSLTPSQLSKCDSTRKNWLLYGNPDTISKNLNEKSVDVFFPLAIRAYLNKLSAEDFSIRRKVIMSSLMPEHGIEESKENIRTSVILSGTAKHTEERKTKDGKTEKVTIEDYDGNIYYTPIDFTGGDGVEHLIQPGEELIIQSKGDSLITMAKDTLSNFYQSSKSYNFQLDELHQNLECKLNTPETDVNEIQMKLEKIFSPSFEELLLYVLKRYGQFTMVLTGSSFLLMTHDDYELNTDRDIMKSITEKATFGMSGIYENFKESRNTRTLLSDLSHGSELMDKYAEFRYWNIFPMIEAEYMMFALPNVLLRTMYNTFSGSATSNMTEEQLEETQRAVEQFKDAFIQFSENHLQMLEEFSNAKEFKESVIESFGDFD